jgi:hypothetical protein
MIGNVLLYNESVVDQSQSIIQNKKFIIFIM